MRRPGSIDRLVTYDAGVQAWCLIAKGRVAPMPALASATCRRFATVATAIWGGETLRRQNWKAS